MTREFDVVVIGAGIQGAGVAQAAAAAGYKVTVIEQYARPAQGTSSRSSKLIHGGLRYLESGQIGLVNECLREREILLRNAPTLVHLVPFFLPIFATTRRRPWQIRIGLSIYSILARLAPVARYRCLPVNEWPRDDGLITTELQAVYRYFDAQTDDAALTQAVIASARTLGAEICYGATLEQINLSEHGATVQYRRGLECESISCRVVINAAGPWVNQVLDRVKPDQVKLPIDLVQGTHIVLPYPTQDGIFYVESPQDQRAVFVMPWQGNTTLVGTTETPYQGNPATVMPLPQEIDYLLATFRHYFPNKSARPDEIVDAFAGLRVLPAGEGHAFGRSRESMVHSDRSSRPRLLSLYGGKLTAYRSMAERVIDSVAKYLPRKRDLKTANIRLLSSANGTMGYRGWVIR